MAKQTPLYEAHKQAGAQLVDMENIIDEIKHDAELVKTAPHTRKIGRLDEVKAAKELDLAWVEGACE